MSKENYKLLVSKLGATVGVKDLLPDDDDYCCLGFDEDVVVHFQYDEEHDVLMLFSQLGLLDDKMAVDLYPRMMHANVFWQGTGGATLGVDMDTKEIIASYQVPFKLLDEESFLDLVEGFVNTAELWVKTLEVVQKGEDVSELTQKK